MSTSDLHHLLLVALAQILVIPVAWAQAEEIELPEGLSALPEVIEFVEAPYPPDALEDSAQADVLLQITVDEIGGVTDAVPLELILYTFDEDDDLLELSLAPQEDPYGFVSGALGAIAQFRFAPALDKLGEPVAVSIVWRYGFYFEEETTEVYPDDEAEADVNLRGVVRDRGSQSPLPEVEVTVTMDDLEHRAMTDAEGVFLFSGLTEGAWRLTMGPDEHEAVDTVEEIVAGQRTDVIYSLERLDYGEYTYEVRAEAVRREVSRQSLSVLEISRIPGNSGDAIRVVENLPGVARAPAFSGLIVVRGSAPEDTRIFIEGVTVPLAFHFGGLAAVINSDLLEELEFIPGAYSAEYGRATAGIINIQTRAPRTDGYHGYLDIDVFDVSLLVEGPITEKWSFFAAGRRSYIDAILPAVIPDDAGLSLTTAPRYWDFQGKIQYDPNVDHSLNLLFYGSDDVLAFVFEEPAGDSPILRGDLQLGTTFYESQIEWEAELADRLRNRALVGVGLQKMYGSLGDDLYLDLRVWPVLHFRDRLEIRPVPSLRIRPGIDLAMGWYGLAFRSPPLPAGNEDARDLDVEDYMTVDDQDQFSIYPGFFLETEWDIIDGLTVVPGVRLDYADPPNEWWVDLRFATRYDVTEDLTLKGAVGTFHQPPQPVEMIESFGNPDLGIESAIHYVVGSEYDITDFLNVDLQLFYKDLDDLVMSSTALVERDGEVVNELFNNEGEGRVYGLELLVRHELANNFFGWISYTLSRSERRDAADEDWRIFEWDQSHILTLVGSYTIGAGWSVGGRFRFVTGSPDTPVVDSVFDADGDRFVQVRGEQLSERVDSFHQLDIRIDKQFTFDAWQLSLYLDVQNVYNHANPEGTSYNFDYTQSTPSTGLPIIPSIGIRGSF